MGELLYMMNLPKDYIVFKKEDIILGGVSNNGNVGAERGASHWMNVVEANYWLELVVDFKCRSMEIRLNIIQVRLQ